MKVNVYVSWFCFFFSFNANSSLLPALKWSNAVFSFESFASFVSFVSDLLND